MTHLVAGLTKDIRAAICITVHFPSGGTSALPRILQRAGKLPAVHAEDSQPLEEGRIYVAPPDHHLLIFRDIIRLYRGARENGNRPAVDPMFRSAAIAYGARCIGVVLSGNLDDGTSGLLAIKHRGGIAIAQYPEEAMFSSMPQSAIDHVHVDYVVKLERLSALLNELTEQPAPTEEHPVPDDARKETEYSEFDLARIEDVGEHPGDLAPFGCPDCGGTLWELREGNLVRFRCRVGHAWTSEALLASQAETLDAALWAALRALEESASLSKQLADRARARGNERLSERMADHAALAERRAATIRNVLLYDRRTQLNAKDLESPETVAEAARRRTRSDD